MSKKLFTFDLHMNFQSLSKTKAKEFKTLSSKKARDITGLFISEGDKSVKDILRVFKLKNLIATKTWTDRNPDIAKEFEPLILLTDNRGMEIVSSLNSLPEIIGIFYIPSQESEIFSLLPDKLYVLLDEVQDPGNLGTIIRTCDWFGIYDIFASKTTVDVYNPKVVQSTMGSLSRVKVHYTDLEKLIKENPKLRVMGTLLNGKPISEISGKNSGFLLMGNEGRGISENLKSLIEEPITIPPENISAHPDSLNVAVATAICLFALTK